MTDPTKDAIRLFLARWFWQSGKPPRNGRFLLQMSNGDIKCDFWYYGWPYTKTEPVVYWKRVNAPLPAPKEYLSYHAKEKLAEGQNVPYVVEYR